MATESIVSLGSPGAGRSTSLVQVYDAGQAIHSMRNRGGVLQDMQDQATSLGFGSNALNQRIMSPANMAAAWELRAQSISYKWRAWPVLTRPGAQFAHPTGLWAMEGLFYWDGNSAAGECGMMFGPTFARQPRINLANNHASFGVLNIGGVLTWISLRAAPLAREIVPLANGGPIGNWNKIRIEIRSATLALDASVKVYINDKLSLTRSWGAGNVYLPDIEATQAAFVPYLIQADLNFIMYFRDIVMYDGPDVPAL